MKRYLILKFGLSVLFYAATFHRFEVLAENATRTKNVTVVRTQRRIASYVESSDSPGNGINNFHGVMGQPGIDFPVLKFIPRTKFSCRGLKSGYYADLDTNCQVFHICEDGRKVSFLCPNGTIFQQSDLICDWWYKVDCGNSPNLYAESAEHLQEERLRRKESRKVDGDQSTAHSQYYGGSNGNQLSTPRVQYTAPQYVYKNVDASQKSQSASPKFQFTASQYTESTKQPFGYKTNQYSYTTQKPYATTPNYGYSQYTKQKDSKSYHSNTQDRFPSSTISNIAVVSQKVEHDKYNTQQQQYYNIPVDVRYDQTTLQYDDNKEYQQKTISGFGSKITEAPYYHQGTDGRSTQFPYQSEKHNGEYSYPNDVQTTAAPSQSPASYHITYGSEQTEIPHHEASTFAPPSNTGNVRIDRPVQEVSFTFGTSSTRLEGKAEKETTVAPPTTKREKVSLSLTFNTQTGSTFSPKTPKEARTAASYVGIPVQIIEDDGVSPSTSKETQLPSESASFVSTKYNSKGSYSKNQIDVTTATFPTTKSQYESYNLSTISNFKQRTGKYYDTTTPVAPVSPFHPNHNYGSTVQSTQHTLYSPTVPPLTRKSTSQTASVSGAFTTPASHTTVRSVSGFYVTKDFGVSAPEKSKISKVELRRKPSLATPPPEQYLTIPVSVVEVQPNSRELSSGKTVTLSQNFEPPVVQRIRSTEKPFNDTQNVEQTPANINGTTPSKFTYLPRENASIDSTPRPTQPTPYIAYNSIPTVTDNLKNMIETLEDIDSPNPSRDIEKYLGNRPGLKVPPSVGPNTLHKLAIYFATALDNIASNRTDETEVTTALFADKTEDEPLLSRSTLDKYHSLFESRSKETTSTEITTVDLSKNDLDSEQTATPKVRQLAKVFTHALIEYLDDPEMFSKVLQELRPTEPPPTSDTEETTTIIPSTPETITENLSYTKEKDEVLDFSDSDKTKSKLDLFTSDNSYTVKAVGRSTTEQYSGEVGTTTSAPEFSLSTPNSIAIDINNEIKLSTPYGIVDDYQASDFSVEVHTGTDSYVSFVTRNNSASPYGKGLQPQNATPITEYVTTPVPPSWLTSLLPPSNSLEHGSGESLHSAHSQSFVTLNRSEEYTTSTAVPTHTTLPPIVVAEIEHSTATTEVETPFTSSPPLHGKLISEALSINPAFINDNLNVSYKSDATDVTERTGVAAVAFDDLPSMMQLSIHDLLLPSEFEIASSQANQIFGSLNANQQELLIERIKEAESNSTTRKLILLLISTCDSNHNNNKTVQETRRIILNALLQTPPTTASRLTETEGSSATSHADVPSSKSLVEALSPRSEIEAHRDSRALDLLRSLYSLAAKWSRK